MAPQTFQMLCDERTDNQKRMMNAIGDVYADQYLRMWGNPKCLGKDASFIFPHEMDAVQSVAEECAKQASAETQGGAIMEGACYLCVGLYIAVVENVHDEPELKFLLCTEYNGISIEGFVAALQKHMEALGYNTVFGMGRCD